MRESRSLLLTALLAASLPIAAQRARAADAGAPRPAPRLEERRGSEVGDLIGYDLIGSDGQVVRSLSIESSFSPVADAQGRWTGETRFEVGGAHVAQSVVRTLVEPRPDTALPLGTRRNTVSLHHAAGARLFELRGVPWFAAAVAAESGDVALLARSERGMPATPDELRVVGSDGKTVRLELRGEPRTLWNPRLSPQGGWLAYTLREPNGGPPLAVRVRHVATGEGFELPARDDLRLADFSEIDEEGALWWIDQVSVARPGGRWEMEQVRHPVARAGASARLPKPDLDVAVAEGGRIRPPIASPLERPWGLEFRRADGALARRIEWSGGVRREGERFGGDEIVLRASPGFALVTRKTFMLPEPAASFALKMPVDVVNTVSLLDAEGRTLFEHRGVRYECVAMADDGDANVCVESLPEAGCTFSGWVEGMQPDHDSIVVLRRDGSVLTRIEEPPVSLMTDRIRISRNGRWLAYFAGRGFGPPRPQRTVVVDLAGGARHEIETGSLDRRRDPDRVSDDGDLLESRVPGVARRDEDYAVIWERPR